MESEGDNQRSIDDHAQLRALLEAAVDGIITIDERGLIEAANPAAERLFGYSSAEMVGQNVNMLMPAPYREEHDGYLANYANTGERKIIGIGREVEGRRKDGSTFPLYLAVSEVFFGQRKMFTGFVHDLTELKKAEAQATQLGRILEDSLNEIFVFDVETHKFVFVNHGALTNIGYSRDELSQMTPADIKPKFSKEKLDKFFEPLIAGDMNQLQLETVHERKDGTRYDVDIRLQKAMWKQKDVVVAIILDVSERKQAQNELAALNAELEERVAQRTLELSNAQEQLVRREKLATLGQLSGGVAHEIRNPLGVIKNSVYFLKMISDQLNSDGQECVEEIEREIDTANRIVNELLDFTRDPPSQVESFSLAEAIDNAVRMARVPSGVKQDVCQIDNSVRVLADQGQIERVVTNLVRNAWQAMSGNGSLTITHTINNDQAVIGVHDDGVGIPEGDLANVFEPLFTAKAKGIGLGLAVSRRYTQRNGGSLTVESTLGEGTVFHLSIPLDGRGQ